MRTYGNPKTGIDLSTPRIPPIKVVPIFKYVTRYAFAPQGESTIHDLLLHAVKATQKSIYLEDQYFVASRPIGGQQKLLEALAELIAKPTFEHMLVLTTGVGTVQPELYQTNRRRRDLLNVISADHRDKVSVWAYTDAKRKASWLHSKTWIFDDQLAIIGSSNFNRRGLSHDGELGVGIIDLDNPTHGWVLQLRQRLWRKHLSSPKRPVTLDQIQDFQQGRALWGGGPDPLVTRMDIMAGDPYQPDKLLVCGAPASNPASLWEKALRAWLCEGVTRDMSFLRAVLTSPEIQWEYVIDPDGT